ncbi:PIG-L deacetylase family protein [Frankia casuarinae]|uniref:PIG-L deacetylase family protein n=1 Tax=Frankia casuarinae (strain DSM 45818 / CECT 9043 / HFP020203 / CcI3) TaxID=106370 RepID=UPI00031177A0|nr:PIG-L family deacetylase [Frankia casuarinae]
MSAATASISDRVRWPVFAAIREVDGMNVAKVVRRVIPGDPETVRDRVMVPARSLWRRAWTRRGIDITSSMTTRSCLVVAPHPDDETLGCAVAIMRKRAAGTPVTVVIVSDGSRAEPVTLPPAELIEVRKAETRRACTLLDVDESDVRFLGFPDAELSDRIDAIAARLTELIETLAPEQILAPTSCEGHPDHDATNEAVRRAVATTGYRGQVLEYTVWFWTHWPWTLGYGTAGWSAERLFVQPVRRLRERRPLLVDARGFRARQRRALAEHATQVGEDDAASDAATPVTGSLLATLGSPYEVYVAAGALRHLDFERPWRAGHQVRGSR